MPMPLRYEEVVCAQKRSVFKVRKFEGLAITHRGYRRPKRESISHAVWLPRERVFPVGRRRVDVRGAIAQRIIALDDSTPVRLGLFGDDLPALPHVDRRVMGSRRFPSHFGRPPQRPAHAQGKQLGLCFPIGFLHWPTSSVVSPTLLYFWRSSPGFVPQVRSRQTPWGFGGEKGIGNLCS